MLIQETIDKLRNLYGESLKRITVERIVIVVFFTGATIANSTIGGILDTVNPHAATIIVGPTASFLPDAFFRRGVDIVSGVTVTEPDRTLDLLAEGSRAHRLFYSCVRKLNIVSPGFCSANTSLKKIVCC